MKKLLVLATGLLVVEQANAAVRSYDGYLSEGIRRTTKMEEPAVPSAAESIMDQIKNPGVSTAQHMANMYLAGKKYDKEKLNPEKPQPQDDTYGAAFVFLSNKFDREVLDNIKKLKDKKGMALDIYIKESDTKLVARDFSNMLQDHAKEVEKKGKLATKADIARGFFAFKMRPDIKDSAAKLFKLEEYPGIVYVAPNGERRQYPFTNEGVMRFESKFARVEKELATGAMKSWSESFLSRLGQY